MELVGIGIVCLLVLIVSGSMLGQRYEFSRTFPLVALGVAIGSTAAAYLVDTISVQLLLLGVAAFSFAACLSSLYLFFIDPAGYTKLRSVLMRSSQDHNNSLTEQTRVPWYARKGLSERMEMIQRNRQFLKDILAAEQQLRRHARVNATTSRYLH